jgi:hypothetical protein
VKRFDLFGSRQLQLSAAAGLIRSALGVEFELHESGYHGGDYYRSLGLEGDEIIVQTNFEDDEGYLAETDFADYPTLVYVNGGSEEVARTLRTIEGLDLLRSEEI